MSHRQTENYKTGSEEEKKVRKDGVERYNEEEMMKRGRGWREEKR